MPRFHPVGWTFVWIVTAAGAKHVCLRRVDPEQVFKLIRQEDVTMLCAAPTVLIGIANARPSYARTSRKASVCSPPAPRPPPPRSVGSRTSLAGRSSVEVEGVLLRHPAVQEAAVVGLPDPKWGEAPHAYVILKPGQQATEDELKQFTRDRLAHFKCPHSVKFVDELPKTATGKIQKYVLRGGKAAIAAQ